MVIHNRDELTALSSSITRLSLSYKTCHGLLQLDLSRFVNVKEIRIDSCSFQSVEEVKMIGLKALERVEIGKKCFMKDSEWPGLNAKGKFYLKDCKKLKKLIIGAYSFREYSICELKNLPAVEVIEMSAVNDWSESFMSASLELKSV